MNHSQIRIKKDDPFQNRDLGRNKTGLHENFDSAGCARFARNAILRERGARVNCVARESLQARREGCSKSFFRQVVFERGKK
jgi:hypothetical protein